MQTTQVNSENVFQHHLEALVKNDLDEIMIDYSGQSEIWTPDGIITGLEAISSFFSNAFTLFPKDKTHFEITKMIVKDYKVYVVWKADSPIVNVPFATDSFDIKEGKIIWQSVAIEMLKK